MPITNSKSVQRGVKSLNTSDKPYDDHLVQKAKKNPKNTRDQVGTEINALIRADYEKAQRRNDK